MTTIHRILVALDASPASAAALEAAARLAAALDAELLGLYVEDECLLRGAELPIARVVGSFSGAVRPVERGEIERQLRLQAFRARQMFETVTAQVQVRRSFKIARGLVARELLTAAGEADLISLGRRGWSVAARRRIGATTETILKETGIPVLLLERGLRPGRGIVLIYDGGSASRKALDLARQWAPDGTAPFTILLPGTREEAERLHAKAQEEVRSLGIHRSVRYVNAPRKDATVITRLRPPEGIGVLILPAADIFEAGFQELLLQLDCPVLVVH